MKGAVWDDLDRGGDLYMQTMEFYDSLKEAFRQQGVELDVSDNFDNLSGNIQEYDFVMLDLVDVSGETIGLKHAESARNFIEPDLPLFILSRDIGMLDPDAVRRLNLFPVPKVGANFVVLTVKEKLYPLGVWVNKREVFVIYCQSENSFSEKTIAHAHAMSLNKMIEDETFQARSLGGPNAVSLLKGILRGILESEKIICLITPDEVLEDGVEYKYVARPNIYLELGMACQTARLRNKTMVLAQSETAIPSDVRGLLHHKFNTSVDERKQEVREFLQR